MITSQDKELLVKKGISEEQIAEITRVYGDFTENEISKIFSNEEFGYSKITVERLPFFEVVCGSFC